MSVDEPLQRAMIRRIGKALAWMAVLCLGILLYNILWYATAYYLAGASIADVFDVGSRFACRFRPHPAVIMSSPSQDALIRSYTLSSWVPFDVEFFVNMSEHNDTRTSSATIRARRRLGGAFYVLRFRIELRGNSISVIDETGLGSDSPILHVVTPQIVVIRDGSPPGENQHFGYGGGYTIFSCLSAKENDSSRGMLSPSKRFREIIYGCDGRTGYFFVPQEDTISGEETLNYVASVGFTILPKAGRYR